MRSFAGSGGWPFRIPFIPVPGYLSCRSPSSGVGDSSCDEGPQSSPSFNDSTPYTLARVFLTAEVESWFPFPRLAFIEVPVEPGDGSEERGSSGGEACRKMKGEVEEERLSVECDLM